MACCLAVSGDGTVTIGEQLSESRPTLNSNSDSGDVA